MLQVLGGLFVLFASLTASAQQIPVPVGGPVSAHACSIMNGALICWGDNAYGQIGDGTTTSALLPVVVIPSGVTAAAVGGNHTCAIVKAALQCWGRNDKNQINASGDDIWLPKTIIAAGVTGVALGKEHSCAIVAGKARCWGSDSDGQIGNGVANDGGVVATPFTYNKAGVTKIFAGANHTCALVGTTAFCWGRGEEGQLGWGDGPEDENPGEEDFEQQSTPIEVGKGVTAMALGENHSCGILAGALWCVGENEDGQLGNGDNTKTSIPAVIIQTGVTSFALGARHTCAVRYGNLKCWGDNQKGQLGISKTVIAENTNVPKTVIGLGVTGVTAGEDSMCAVKAGELSCTGSNDLGQLGNGTTDDSDELTTVILK